MNKLLLQESFRLGRSLYESGIADNRTSVDVDEFAERIDECPRTVSTIRESDVDISAALAGDGLASHVKNLAPQVLLCDFRVKRELESVDTGASRGLHFTDKTALIECNVARELVESGDAHIDLGLLDGFIGRRSDALDKGGVADDGDHILCAALEGPRPEIAVAEGDIAVSASQDDDRLVEFVADLATKALLLDGFANFESDGIVGAIRALGSLNLTPTLLK